MTIELGVVLKDGRTWYAVTDTWNRKQGAVIVPVDEIAGLSDEEIGSLVHVVAKEVPYARAHDTAENLLAYGSTIQAMRNTPDAEKYLAELEPFIDRSDVIRRAYDRLYEVVEAKQQRTARSLKERDTVKTAYDHLFIAIGRRDGFSCARCGAAFELELDHIIPVSLGGTSDLDNLQILCRPCNQKKGATSANYRPRQSNM